MKCIKCGLEIPETAKYCPACGQKNDGFPLFCMHCGSKVDETMKFCENCGKPIEKLSKEEDDGDIHAPTLSVEDVVGTATTVIEHMQDKLNPQAHGAEFSAKRDAMTPGDKIEQPEKVFSQGATPNPNHTPSRAPQSLRPESAAQTAQQVQTQAAAQTQIPTQNVAPVAQPAPVAPSAPVAQAATVGSAAVSTGAKVASALGSEVIHTAGKVATETVKKSVSTAKIVAICALVVTFVVGALSACLNFFVPAPVDTVLTLFESVEELDYEKMLSCMDKKTESTIRATLGITGGVLGSLTGLDVDLEDLMAFAPSLAPSLDTPDLGIAEVETVFYSDCSQKKILEYCIQANSGEFTPEGYDADNAIMHFLNEYNLTLPGLENLVAKSALVKLTTENGEVLYLPLINEGWGDWRIPLVDLAAVFAQ